MLINLTDIFQSEQKISEQEVLFTPDEVTSFGETVQIVRKEPSIMKLSNEGKGKIAVTGHMDLTLAMVCDRCLKPMEVSVSFDYEEHITEDGLTNPEDADEFFYMDGSKFDVDQYLGNEILINWPPKVLCKDDCKGICKVCGKDLNLGECGCDDFVPDPRMAVIKDIFNIANADKEV